MKLKMRKFRGEDDFWRIREFLNRLHLQNKFQDMIWHVSRWDYVWVRKNDFLPGVCWEDAVFIWETEDGEIAAVLNPEEIGIVFEHVDPRYRSSYLEQWMINIAEEHLAVEKEDGTRKVYIHAGSMDEIRHSILGKNGYVPFDHPKVREHLRRRTFSEPIPSVEIHPDYTVRALQEDELKERGLAAWKTTQDDDPPDEYSSWHWLLNVQQAPLYCRDLDIVAVIPSGEIVAFCTMWYDDISRSGCFEPVGTVPDHRQRGLAKAVLCEALHRIKALGADTAYVSSFSEPAHSLYKSIGFMDYVLIEPWVKEW